MFFHYKDSNSTIAPITYRPDHQRCAYANYYLNSYFEEEIINTKCHLLSPHNSKAHSSNPYLVEVKISNGLDFQELQN